MFLSAVRWAKKQSHRALFLWALRDSSYRSFYDGLNGELLTEEKRDDFGSVTITSVAYGWRDLEALSSRLEKSE